jgi:hypothetical protein
MSKYNASASALAVIVMMLYTVAAHAQSCTTPGPSDFYTDKDNAGASDSNDGHYVQNGGKGPFKTIQHLADVLQPGQCGFVRKSATPYFENNYRAGDYSGVVFTKGGTSEASRITVAGYPGEHPVLDQQRAAVTKGYGIAGFFVYSGSYITIRNFEVLNTIASGILMNPSGPTDHINIDGNHVHNMAGNGNPNNVGGIRLDYCHYCIVSNNIVNNVGDDMGADGINGFQPGACTIANNLVYNVALGVQLKQADAGHLNAHDVHDNIFANISVAAYKMQIQGANNMAAAHNATFYNNVVYNSNDGIYVDLSEAGEQATGLTIYNNTFVNTGSIGNISNFTGIQVYNNIYSGSSNSFTQYFIFDTFKPTPWVNRITYFDNNLYFNLTPHWELETYNNPQTYNSLAAWRTASGDATTPDLKSVFADPLFLSATPSAAKLLSGDVSDLALAPSSVAIAMGRNGDTIGAVRAGVLIGPQLASAAIVPMPPVILSVQ